MKLWPWILAGTVVVLALAGSQWAIDRSRETIGPVRGLRLGDAPARARERFRPGTRGEFRTIAMGEDFALDWAPRSGGDLRSARLEFHDAMLVAVRLTLTGDAPEASGPPLETTEASVLTRERSRAGVELTWIARSCPVHADEVRRRLASRR